MLSFTDQAARQITLARLPNRIISLVPSQTELLFDLGLREEVIGITKFCVHPDEWFRTKTRIGGTKQLKMDTIHQLQPDLVIANKEENVKEQVEELASHYPVWISDVNNLEDACNMIHTIGKMTGKGPNAETIIKNIIHSFSRLPTPDSRLRTIYLIWHEPYMTVGGDTFISAMMNAAGFENIYAAQTRYPSITIEELIVQDPQVLFLSSEPYPFQQKHAEELQSHLPQTKVLLVDGEMFSWYGSRLLKAPAYFAKLQEEIKTNR